MPPPRPVANKEKPITLRTDHFQYDLFVRSETIRISRLKILAGEIVPGKVFASLRKADFVHYPRILKVIKEVIAQW